MYKILNQLNWNNVIKQFIPNDRILSFKEQSAYFIKHGFIIQYNKLYKQSIIIVTNESLFINTLPIIQSYIEYVG